MKKKEILKQIIRDFHLSGDFSVKPRALELPVDSGKIITLIGVRRCGKTSILYDVINRLTQKIDKTQILFINFEDERLELEIDELDLILQSYRELYPSHNLKECYFFFDEIQNITGWEKFIRRLYDTITPNIFVTGTNAKLLSSEIASSLRGRSLTFEVYPLSLREYLEFKDIEVDLYSSASLAHIKNAMDSFLVDGGFPETLFLDQKYTTQMLQGYLGVMIYKDLIERYGISNTTALKFFLKRIIASSTKQISINKIYNELKSSGIKIGKNSLYDFLDYVQNIYLALTLHRYDASLVNQELGEKKIYSIDIGLTNAIAFRFSDNRGKALESAVFLELKRQSKEIYYYSDKSSECDFIVSYNGAVIEAIQVGYEMSQDETKAREIKGVLSACKAFGLSKGMIITYDEEDELIEDGVTIEVTPFYRWVLER